MTLQEICKILNRSENSLTSHFLRTQENFKKKGIIIIKEGIGKNATYDIQCEDPISLPVIPNGTKINKLTVIGNEKREMIYYKCKCECGNIVIVRGSNLKNGNTKSCGCLQKEKYQEWADQFNLVGQNFGKLTVIEKTEERNSNGRVIYKCQCECGGIIKVDGSSLKRGLTQSCGCLKSKGEEKISLILQTNNITFEKGKTFQSCKNIETNYPFKFDFYVENEYIIEYDGIQHFKYREKGWDSKDKLEKTQKYDQFKNQWCQENNILLIRIPYWHLDNLIIDDLIPKTSKFLIKKEE